MKKRTIIALLIVGLAVLTAIIASIGYGFRGSGFVLVYITAPMILVGIISLFSPVSALTIFFGTIIHAIVVQTITPAVSADPSLYAIKYIGPVVLLTGVLYGFIEGMVKATQHQYKPPVD